MYAVRFAPTGDGERLVAWIRVAGAPGRLAAAEPVPYLLSTAPSQAVAFERYRALHNL